MNDLSLNLVLRQIRLEAEGICSFDLAHPHANALPTFKAGAHIDVQIPNGPRRSYSIASSPAEHRYWRIAVKLEPQSRGGSAWFHHKARVGMTVSASLPRNAFELDETGTQSLFFAGGIGITPILAMLERLNQQERRWTLHYASRTTPQMAFSSKLNQLASRSGNFVHTHISNMGEENRMHLAEIITAASHDTHFYCCGPARMIDAFLQATKDLPSERIHYERFGTTQEAASDGNYSLHLLRDGRHLQVPKGKSMLDALLDAGLDIPYSCTQGVCGSCRVTVAEGTPDHRDSCLSKAEQDSGAVVIPCCSGSHSPVLVLDL
jgi:ferredoxin-NADP reductase